MDTHWQERHRWCKLRLPSGSTQPSAASPMTHSCTCTNAAGAIVLLSPDAPSFALSDSFSLQFSLLRGLPPFPCVWEPVWGREASEEEGGRSWMHSSPCDAEAQGTKPQPLAPYCRNIASPPSSREAIFTRIPEGKHAGGSQSTQLGAAGQYLRVPVLRR